MREDRSQKTTTTTYRVTYVLRNAKGRSIAVEIREDLRYETAQTCEGDATLTGQEIRIEDHLAAGQEKTLRYQLTLQTVTETSDRR